MRKLATVRRISDIRPIPNADLIELAVVDGWQCVVKKGEFAVGELVVYCEIDTVLPIHPDYEHLRKYCYVQAGWLPRGEGFRLRTMKFRGQVSQGLLLPLSRVYEHDRHWVPVEGHDVTHYLGIIKWDPPLPPELEGKARGRYPSYIPKTSQERVQNLVGNLFTTDPVMEGLNKEKVWEVTLKLDGESCTFYHANGYKGHGEEDFTNGRVGVCSRTVDFILDQEGNPFVDMFHRLDIASKLPTLWGNFAIQGELMGPGIHGNREKLTEHQFYVYDVWDIDGQHYLPKDVRDLVIYALELQSVPVIHPGATLIELGCNTLEAMLQYADRPSMNHKVAEGVVFKAVRGSHVEDLLYSFKCINNRYLLGAS